MLTPYTFKNPRILQRNDHHCANLGVKEIVCVDDSGSVLCQLSLRTKYRQPKAHAYIILRMRITIAFCIITELYGEVCMCRGARPFLSTSPTTYPCLSL